MFNHHPLHDQLVGTKERLMHEFTRIPWSVEFLEDHSGKPSCVICEPDHPKHWVKTIGRKGIDQSILFERAWIAALELELSRATDSALRKEIEDDLARAHKEEQISQAIRREKAERESSS